MSETFTLGANANQVKFKMSGVQGQEQEIIILENLKILADVLRTPRKLNSLSDEKPLIERDKEGLFIINHFEESKKISGYIQTEQAFARKFPFVLKEGGISFKFSPPKNEKLSQNFLSASKIYRFFAIEAGINTKVLELGFVPISEAIQEQIMMEVEEDEGKSEEETKLIMAKEIEEADMPMVFELLSELPSTCSLSSSSAKVLAVEIKNLREEKIILEDKIQNIEVDFLSQKNLMEFYAMQVIEMTSSLKKMETEAEERKNQMDEMMKAVRQLQNNLEKEQTQKSTFERQLYERNDTIEQMKKEIEHLRFANEDLQITVKHHKEIEEERLKEVKKTAPVNASLNSNLFPRQIQTVPNSGKFREKK